MKITLTSEQKKTLELRHNKVRDVHECDRIKAILLSSVWSAFKRLCEPPFSGAN
jgi:hypothetical protein